MPEKHERLDRVDSDNRSVYIISGIELGAEEPESIIKDIRQFADTVGEEEIADFLEKSGVLLGKTMPNGNVRFGILGESEERECDYYWKNNNIMYFSSDQEDDMKAAEKAGVRCIYGPDGCTDKVKKLLGELI